MGPVMIGNKPISDQGTIGCIIMMLCLCFGSVLLSAGSGQAGNHLFMPDEGTRILGIDIEISGAGRDLERWEKTAKNLIAIEPGTDFSSRKLDMATAALKSCELFVIEKAEPRKNDNGELMLCFRLSVIPRIKDIQITGSFPIFEREVLNAMTVYSGDAFQEEEISQQSELIVNLFQEQGYVAPEVLVHSVRDEESGHYILNVDIHKGLFFRIDGFELQGNDSFSDARLKIRLQSWQSSLLPGSMSRYRKKELDEDVKNLILFYRKNHYPEVTIVPVVVKDDDAKTIRITLNISEGPFYNIRFQGNHEFWDWTLQDDLQLFHEGVSNNFRIRKTARAIRERYLKKGYMDCRVRMENDSENQKGPDRRINFIIEEGKQAIVNRLKIIGNQSISEDIIRAQIITEEQGTITTGEFIRQVLDDDIRGVITLYLKQGYPDVKVDEEIVWVESRTENKKYADILFTIQEGEKVIVTSVIFKGLSDLSEDWAMENIVMKPGDPFREYMIQNDKNKLAMHISERGYPHVKIHGEPLVDRQTGEVHITYEINQGPYVKTGETITVGNFRTEKSVVEKEFTLEEGKPFSMMKMIEGQRNIQNINAFKTVNIKPIGLKEESEKIDFLVEIEEKKPYAVQASIGYDTSRRLYVNTRLSDLNLLGLNKEAWIGMEGSQIGNRGQLGIMEPRLLDTRISASGNLFWEKREELNVGFGTESYGLMVAFARKLPHNLSANLAFRYERKEQYLRDEKVLSPDDEEAYDPRGILVTSPSIVYNSVDSFIRPQKGVFSSIGIDFSRGLENSLDNFITYRYEIRLYSQIHKRIVFAVRGRAGYIVPSGEESVIPEDQLFFLGGLSSVRGYDENRLRVDQEGEALGGRTELIGSIETRFDIGFNLELAPFYDIGSVRNTLIDEGDNSFRASSGISLRYITPYLPIGIQYAHILDKQAADKSNGRFYFTVGYTF
jgi:outer membrane protein insertion porin family